MIPNIFKGFPDFAWYLLLDVNHVSGVVEESRGVDGFLDIVFMIYQVVNDLNGGAYDSSATG